MVFIPFKLVLNNTLQHKQEKQKLSFSIPIYFATCNTLFSQLPYIHQQSLMMKMTKVHPRAIAAKPHEAEDIIKPEKEQNPSVLTVWMKSLLFNCDGFAVFGPDGKLIYRVENYAYGRDILLMDAFGKSLLTVRHKKRSMSWLVFDGETINNPIFSARKNTNLLNTKSLAHVSSVDGHSTVYEIEGSFSRRCCAVYDGKRRMVAEIKRKEASVKGVDLGMDIFSLVIEAGFDKTLAMSFVIILDQMFGSSISRRNRFFAYC